MSATLDGTVVIKAGTCEVLLTEAGFYARCTECQQTNGVIVHARFKARQWADGHACPVLREIRRLEDEHRDAVDAYIKTRLASHQRRMVEISREVAALRNPCDVPELDR